jgi:hypothetical protein
MGVNNRQRRAAKAKRRAKDRARRFGGSGWHGPACRCGERADEPLFTPRERVAMLIELAVAVAGRPDAVRAGSDAAGWVRGKLAADLAQLTFADLDADPGDDRTDAKQPAFALGI